MADFTPVNWEDVSPGIGITSEQKGAMADKILAEQNRGSQIAGELKSARPEFTPMDWGSRMPGLGQKIEPLVAPKENRIKDTVSELGRSIWEGLTVHTPASVAAAYQGMDVSDEGISGFLIDRSKALQQQRAAEPGGDRPSAIPGIKMQDVRDLGQNLGFSLTAMGAGLAAGIPASVVGSLATPAAGAVAGYGAGMAAAGKVGYNMDVNQVTRQLKDAADEESQRVNGRPQTPEEWQSKLSEMKGEIQKHGLYEAIPEALGSGAGFAILTTAAKVFGKGVVARFASKLGALYGEEMLTETVTQMGQQNAETRMGLHRGEKERSFTSPEDWLKSAKEVAPQIFLLTTLTAGAGKAIQMAHQAGQPSAPNAPETPPLPTGQPTPPAAAAPAVAPPMQPTPVISPDMPGQLGSVGPIPEGQAIAEGYSIPNPPGYQIPSIDFALTGIDLARSDAQKLKAGQDLPAGDPIRLRNATLVSVYGENAAVRHVIEQPDRFAAIGDAMFMVAPTVERVRGAIGAKAEGLDITPDILGAIDEFAKMKENGHTLGQAMAHSVAHDISYEGQQLMAFLDEHQNDPQKIAQFIENYLHEVEMASGVPSQVRGRAFDIIQERNAAKQKELEKLRAEAEAKAARQKESEVGRMGNQAATEVKVKQSNEREKATLQGAETALAAAFKNAKSLKRKGKPNAKPSPEGNGGLPPATPSNPQGGAGQGEPVAGRRSGPVPQPNQAAAQVNAQPVRETRNRQGAGEKPVNRAAAILAELKPLDQAAHEAATSPLNNVAAPTPSQIEAGNYKKGAVRVGGLEISIENPAGSKRRPEWPALKSHYGYVKGVLARSPDKEHTDVFVKPGTSEDYNGPVFVVDQNRANGRFDESKTMIGWSTAAEARAAYLENYTKGFESRIRSITELSMDEYKAKLRDASAFLKPQAAPKRPNRGRAMAEERKKAAQAKPESHLFAAIKEMGGIASSLMRDLTGESNAVGKKGVRSDIFRRRGALTKYATEDLSDIARLLKDRGYTIDTDTVDGGAQQVRDMIADEMANPGTHRSAFDEQAVFDQLSRERKAAEKAEAEAATALAGPAPSGWNTMTEEQQNAELDSLFGEPAKAPETARAPVDQGEVGQGKPALELTGQTADEARAEAERVAAIDKREAADKAALAAEETRKANQAETDRRKAEVLAEREAAKKAEIEKARVEFALGQEAPKPVVKKVTTDEAAGQGDLLASVKIASGTNLAPDLSASVESALTDADKAEAARELGEKEWSPSASKKFLQGYAEWLQQGAKNVATTLGKLFQKVYEATRNGLLSIAVAMNFNVAQPIMPVMVKPTQQTLTEIREKPRADFKGVSASADAHITADWMVRNGLTKGGPFLLADKLNGVMYAFDGDGALIAKSPALFGASKGDILTAEQAAKPIEQTTQADKITPAGIYPAQIKSGEYGNSLYFADYGATQLAVHRVYLGTPSEQRMQRLQSENPNDNRISYGCINALPEFIDNVIIPNFAGKSQVVILPDSTSAESYFGINDNAFETTTTTITSDTHSATAVSWGGDKYAIRDERQAEPSRATTRRRKGEIDKGVAREAAVGQGDLLAQPKQAYNPDQLELIYDHTPTRPGTTDVQRRLGIAALRGLFGGDRRAGATLLGSALWRDFQERAGAELIGQQAGSASELALAAQILRDPRFETMRVFFVKAGQIVGHTGWTSRLPGSVAFSIETSAVSKRVKAGETGVGANLRRALLKHEMAQLEADGYYVLHNHPSGRAIPSRADEEMTIRLAKEMPGFLGHVVIDHNEAAVIDKNGKSNVGRFSDLGFPPQTKRMPEVAHDVLGMPIVGPSGIVAVGNMLETKKGYATLIATNAQGQVQALAEVPETMLLEGKDPMQRGRALVRIRKFMNGTGSAGGAFIVAENPARFDWLIKKGALTDAVDTKPDNDGHHATRSQWGVLQPRHVTEYGHGSRMVLAARQMVWNEPERAEQPKPGYNINEARSAVAGNSPMNSARLLFDDLTRSDRVLNRVISKVNTPFHIAETHPSFAPVYQEAQDFNHDISRVANEAADLAPDLLPRIEKFSDFAKKAPSQVDIDAVQSALNEGTLWGGGNPMDGKVWTDDELRTGSAVTTSTNGQSVRMANVFTPLNDRQIKVYRQALASAAHTMDEHAKSLISRIARTHKITIDNGMGLADVAQVARDKADAKIAGLTLRMQSMNDMGERDESQKKIDELNAFKASVSDIENKTNRLNAHGYFPLMRFGKYAVNVHQMRPDGTREELFFGRYETQEAANIARRELGNEYPQGIVTSGIMNDEAYKIFQGLNVDALQHFAEHMKDEQGNPMSADPVMQAYFRMAATERSVMKRQIHRKGVAGYSKDLSRVLAQFTVSTARSTSSNYHGAEMLSRVQDVKGGDLQAYATRYVRYVSDPQEESQMMRGFLANYYILGSLAFGAINMTQPVLVTAPYLSKFTNYGNGVRQLAKAAYDYATGRKRLTKAEAIAYEKGVKEGIIAPQEIHQIRAEGAASMLGDSPTWNKLTSVMESMGIKIPSRLAFRKAMFLWGSIYSLTEQFNRGTTFLAAYRIAVEKKMDHPYEFAREAVEATQFTYNKANRVELSRGNIGSVIMTFKQFNISYIELAKRLYDTDKKAFAVMMLTLMVFAGMQGLPFAEDAEDIIDTIGQWLGYGTNSKKALRKLATEYLGKDMAEVLLNGTSAIPGMPLDVSARMGMHNLIPGSAMLKASEPDKTRDIMEILGPAATLFKNVGTATEGLATGRPSETKALLPSALQNLAKGVDMVETGVYRDSKGRKVMDASAADAFVKMVGFQPAEVARETRIVGQNQQDIAMQRVMEDAIASQMARGLMERDKEAIEEAKRKMIQWNTDNPGLRVAINAGQIARRIREIGMSREQRFIKSAPREIRQSVGQDIRQ